MGRQGSQDDCNLVWGRQFLDISLAWLQAIPGSPECLHSLCSQADKYLKQTLPRFVKATSRLYWLLRSAPLAGQMYKRISSWSHLCLTTCLPASQTDVYFWYCFMMALQLSWFFNANEIQTSPIPRCTEVDGMQERNRLRMIDCSCTRQQTAVVFFWFFFSFWKAGLLGSLASRKTMTAQCGAAGQEWVSGAEERRGERRGAEGSGGERSRPRRRGDFPAGRHRGWTQASSTCGC